jgi:hypothetical protein
MGRASLVVLYSRHLGMLRHQSLGAGTPWAKVVTACAYHSWFVFITELNCLPGKLGGEPCACDTGGGHVDTQLIL